jgi:hypothetical protein
MTPTKCMEEGCIHLILGGKTTHFYLCELGHPDYCEEPQYEMDEDIWKDMGK